MRLNRLLLALAIWSVFGIVCLVAEYAHAGESSDIGFGKATFEEGIGRKPLQHRHLLKDSASKEITHSDTVKPIPPGLAKIMAEGAGRAVNPTCDDVRAVVAWIGEARAVEMAREAGASNSQIDKARRCLK
jgi:hypothetical protein